MRSLCTGGLYFTGSITWKIYLLWGSVNVVFINKWSLIQMVFRTGFTIKWPVPVIHAVKLYTLYTGDWRNSMRHVRIISSILIYVPNCQASIICYIYFHNEDQMITRLSDYHIMNVYSLIKHFIRLVNIFCRRQYLFFYYISLSDIWLHAFLIGSICNILKEPESTLTLCD